MSTIHQRFERPNTVSGLEAKRAELVKYRTALEAEIVKVTCDIDHLEAAIRLFDPTTTPNAIKRYVVRHRAKKGSVKAFILDTLREADAPMTAAQLTDLWLAKRGLRVDEATRIVMRKRIGAGLIASRARGVVRNEGVGADGYKGWVVA
jgi:hypothetical protein